MSTDPAAAPSLRTARSFLALLRNPAARRALGAVLAGRPAEAEERHLQGLHALGALRQDDAGPALDADFLASTVAALDRALGPLAVLDGARIDVRDLPQAQVDPAVAAVARRVLAPGEEVTESELNGRLALFVRDVAFFRRHAVDTGVAERAADGSAYRLVGPCPERS